LFHIRGPAGLWQAEDFPFAKRVDQLLFPMVEKLVNGRHADIDRHTGGHGRKQPEKGIAATTYLIANDCGKGRVDTDFE
jgi:hypothetical protein